MRAKPEVPRQNLHHRNRAGMIFRDVAIYFEDGGKEMEKTCPQCHKRLPLSQFGLRVMRTSDGEQLRLQPWCVKCR